jgi:aspartate/methionine/tyrosine aminotransferase
MDSGMFRPAQFAAVKALQVPASWYEDLNAVYSKRRKKVFELLDLLGCQYTKEQVGMFVWATIPEGYADGFAVSDEILKKAHVFITPGGIFGSNGDNYIRISLCGKLETFEEAIERIKNI